MIYAAPTELEIWQSRTFLQTFHTYGVGNQLIRRIQLCVTLAGFFGGITRSV